MRWQGTTPLEKHGCGATGLGLGDGVEPSVYRRGRGGALEHRSSLWDLLARLPSDIIRHFTPVQGGIQGNARAARGAYSAQLSALQVSGVCTDRTSDRRSQPRRL